MNTSNTMVLGTGAAIVKVPGNLSITNDVSANQANLNNLLVNGEAIIGGDAFISGLTFLGSLGAAGNTSLCRNASNQIATCSSSLRYKTEVRPFLSGLEIINRLRPIAFTWKTDGSRDLGLAAEDVAVVEPLLIIRNAGGEIEGVKDDRLNVVLINAVKQQQQQIEQLQSVERLQVAGDIRVGTGASGCVKDANGTVIAGTCSSDLRLKTSITPFPNVLEKLARQNALRQQQITALQQQNAAMKRRLTSLDKR